MQIEVQRNGVKIIGARPKAIRDCDFEGRLFYKMCHDAREFREFLVTLYLNYVGIPVITMQFLHPDKVLKVRRGKITGFSNHSCRRLRDLLLSVYIPGKSYLAITVTLPGGQFFDLVQALKLSWITDLPLSVFIFDIVTPSQWAFLIKRFRQNLIRRHLAGVWRVELQKRNVPHLHIIGFGNDIYEVSDYAASWFEAVDFIKDSRGVSLSAYEGFLIYGFVCKFVRSENWAKYVAAHSAKHKVSQLGWNGRQWGVFNESLLHHYDGLRLDFTEDVNIKILRCLRRMTGYKGFNINLFGSLQLFVNPGIIKRLVDFYSSPLPF